MWGGGGGGGVRGRRGLREAQWPKRSTRGDGFERRAQELSGSRGGRPKLPVPNSPYSFCGRKATLNFNSDTQSSGAV